MLALPKWKTWKDKAKTIHTGRPWATHVNNFSAIYATELILTEEHKIIKYQPKIKKLFSLHTFAQYFKFLFLETYLLMYIYWISITLNDLIGFPCPACVFSAGITIIKIEETYRTFWSKLQHGFSSLNCSRFTFIKADTRCIARFSDTLWIIRAELFPCNLNIKTCYNQSHYLFP